jgi:hypothetical protein
MRQVVPTFELRSPVADTVVAGRRAAHFEARFKVEMVKFREPCDVLTRFWLVPRGADAFIIAMSGPPDGDEASNSEFADILRSIVISD